MLSSRAVVRSIGRALYKSQSGQRVGSVISVRIFPLSLSFLVFRFFRSVTVIVNENWDFSVTVTVRGLFRYVFVTVIVRVTFSLGPVALYHFSSCPLLNRNMK